MVNQDAERAIRTVFTYFDALSDVGGLNGILIIIANIIGSIFNTNVVENHQTE